MSTPSSKRFLVIDRKSFDWRRWIASALLKMEEVFFPQFFFSEKETEWLVSSFTQFSWEKGDAS